MWISKKKYKELEKRVADLEQYQSQQIMDVNLKLSDSNTYDIFKKYAQKGQVHCS